MVQHRDAPKLAKVIFALHMLICIIMHLSGVLSSLLIKVCPAQSVSISRKMEGADVFSICAADNGAPKANVLAYGSGYVQLQGETLRVIPHVQNLETCARHCDMDSQCTHWRRCAGAPFCISRSF